MEPNFIGPNSTLDSIDIVQIIDFVERNYKTGLIILIYLNNIRP